MLSPKNQRRLDNYKAAVKAGEVWMGKGRKTATDKLIDSLLEEIDGTGAGETGKAGAPPPQGHRRPPEEGS